MENLNVEPLFDRVFLDPIKEEKTEGGLFIPTTSQGKELRKYKVVAVGPGKFDVEKRTFIEPNLKVGDVVYVNPLAGHALRLSRNPVVEVLVQREDEIVGKVRK